MASGAGGDKDGWIRMQEKTFTRWMNTYLKNRGMEIEEGALCKEVENGVKLCNLFEVIGKDSCKTICNQKINANPKMRIQMLENHNVALKYLEKKEIKLVNVGANDLVDGNLKIILGMLWTVILRFEVSEDGKKGLLLWCQRCTKPDIGDHVQNFDRSWNDGTAFCALIHHHRPDLIDFDSLDKSDEAGNMELAFKVAEEQLGIERLLDVEDIVGNPKPDDKSIIAYLTQFYKLFASAMKNENYIKTIERAVQITRHHENLIESYQPAGELKEWVGGKTAEYTDAALPANTAATKDELDNFYEYKTNQKPPKQGQLLELEGVMGALQSSCKNNDRPMYTPAAGLEPAQLEADWEEMEKAENAHEARLREQYGLFQDVDFKRDKFKAKADKTKAWVADHRNRFNERAFDSNDVGPVEAETMVDAHQIFDSQLEEYKKTYKVLLGLIDDVKQVPQHEDVARLVEDSSDLGSELDAIEREGEIYKGELNVKLEKEKKLAEAQKQAAKDGELILFGIDDLEDQIDEPVVANSADACVQQLERLSGPIADELKSLEGRVGDLKGVVNELKEAGKDQGLRKEISDLCADDSSRMDDLARKHAQRKHKLVTQQAGEERKEQLRKAFADIANDIKQYCTDKTHAVEALEGDLANQIAAVDALVAEHQDNAPKMEAAEKAGSDCADIGIVINPYTTETIHSLRALWAELTKTFTRTRDQLAEQKLAEEGAKLTPEQYKEIREVFKVFDVDNNDSLTLKEFADGCEGMGLGLTDQEAEDRFRSYAAGSEKISFDQFTDFMLKELETGSTQPDVLNAFQNLAGAPFITDAQIAQHFRNKETAGYLTEKIPAGAEADQKDYETFVPVLFSV